MVAVITYTYNEAVCHELSGFTFDPFLEPVHFVSPSFPSYFIADLL